MAKHQEKKPCILDTKTVGGLIGKCAVLLAAPYVYLILCGLILDKWLQLYESVPYIFYSLLALYAAAIALIVILIVRFVKARKGNK